MKNVIACEAILIASKEASFAGKDGEIVKYWEGKFIIEGNDGRGEYLAIRSKETPAKLADLQFKDIYDGNFEYGTLTYAWVYSKYTEKHAPKFISFE